MRFFERFVFVLVVFLIEGVIGFLFVPDILSTAYHALGMFWGPVVILIGAFAALPDNKIAGSTGDSRSYE